MNSFKDRMKLIFNFTGKFMNTFHDYIYGQTQVEYFNDEDFYHNLPESEEQDKQAYEEEYEHPLLGYYGC